MMKYVISTKHLALKLKPKFEDEEEEWSVIAYSDSDFAGNVENRRSIAGFVLYLNGAPISWKSKGMKSTALSSSEAEFISLSETAKEVSFVYQVMKSMGIELKLPIVIRVDNIGAIFMSENVAISNRTKHVDVRYHFVREFVQDGFIKVIFVKSEENDADLFNKNLGSELHWKHANKLLGKEEQVEKID